MAAKRRRHRRSHKAQEQDRHFLRRIKQLVRTKSQTPTSPSRARREHAERQRRSRAQSRQSSDASRDTQRSPPRPKGATVCLRPRSASPPNEPRRASSTRQASEPSQQNARQRSESPPIHPDLDHYIRNAAYEALRWSTGPLARVSLAQHRPGKPDRRVLPLIRVAQVFDTIAHVYATLLAARNYYQKQTPATRRFGMARNEQNWYATYLLRPRGRLRNEPTQRPKYYECLRRQGREPDDPKPMPADKPVAKARPATPARDKSPKRKVEKAETSPARVKQEPEARHPLKQRPKSPPRARTTSPTPKAIRKPVPDERDFRRRRRHEDSYSPTYSDDGIEINSEEL